MHHIVASLLGAFSVPAFRCSFPTGQYLWELIGPKQQAGASGEPSSSEGGLLSDPATSLLPVRSANGLYLVKLYFQGACVPSFLFFCLFFPLGHLRPFF